MAFEYLNRYVERVKRRLLASAVLKGLAIAAMVALLMTVLLVAVNYRLDVQAENWNWSRALLFLSIAAAITFGIALPVMLINRRRAAQKVEQTVPGLDQRLITCLENKDESNPMVALVAEQAWEKARAYEPSQLVGSSWIASFAGTAVVSLGVLAWLILAGPGWLGQGSALLWGGVPKGASVFNRELKVEPGSTKVRRRADMMVTAQVSGMNPPSVRIFARFHKAGTWEEVPMMPVNGATDKWNFLFAGLADSVDYYVVAGSLKSQQYTLTAVDLPGVKKIKTTYHFPSWSGMPDQIENPGGDLRAVTGTDAYLEIETDKPLEKPVLLMDDGTRVPVHSKSPITHLVTVSIRKDGSFHLAMLENDKAIRLTDDYFVEALKEGPPEVKISRPGRDAKVSPIEEVAFEISATDDFGLHALSFHYSVNGGTEQTVQLPIHRGSKNGSGSYQLNLEDFKLSPGDNVMFYAKAHDAKSESSTDVFFLEAQPYEREFSQSQQQGGGGGGQQDQDGNIVQRQKEIISATFQEDKTKKNANEAKENAKFLSETQEKLRQQAQTFVQRIRARQLAGQNETIELMAKDMTEAANAMSPAVEALRGQKFKDALPHEQKALQYLQRAEARRKEIEVAMGQQGGGGGGGAQRDLESLLDLELDTEKNQYETGQQMSAEQKQRETDEALRKLEELARRQQELASNNRQNQQSPEQRWQQEMLRREAEKLQQELERLQKNQQQSQQQAGQQSQSGQQSQQSGQQGQSGQQSRQQQKLNRDPRLDKAMEQLKEAANDMRRATANQQNGQQNDAETRRAAERLNEARNLMRDSEKSGREQQLSDLSRRSEELAQRQRDFEKQMRNQYGQGENRNPNARSDSFKEGQDPQKANQLADEKAKMMEDYQKLEKDLQDAARQLRSSQRSASAKLQEGLGDAQKEDLNLKMKMMSEYIRRGYGQYMAGREKEITKALDALRDKVKEAEKMAGPGGNPQDPNEKALAQVERLRQQVAELTRQQGQQGGSQQGNQKGQGQQSKQGQQQGQGQQQQGQQGGQQGGQGQQQGQGQGQQAGNQPGQGQQQGQGRGQQGNPSEQRGGGGSGTDRGAMNMGERQPGLPNAAEMRGMQQNFSQGLRDLEANRNRLGSTPEDQAEIQKLLREMAALDPNRFKGNPALVEQMRSQLLPVLEQLELKLRREMDAKEAGSQARSATPDRVPTGYADQVAEYFRRLSKGSATSTTPKKN
ncbi:hypothetical protein [Bryobacter aggregatus]|uniref:hypothetical protein n=1 Tax=Bryobacter aggregatus TaxID=360054 RepID=UPI00056A24B3|nr:hypothetical protein [Bryobacter aggregatus]